MQASTTLSLRVHEVTQLSPDVKSVVLVAADGSVILPSFAPGSHIELCFESPEGGELRRCYSLLNDPLDVGRYVVGVGLHPQSRGGSRYVHESLQPGVLLRSSQPRNHFPLVESAGLTIFIAGGIGITPLLCMARRLSSIGKAWRLYYCVKTPARAAFIEDAQGLAGGEVISIYDGIAGVQPLDLARVVSSAAAEDHLYCCGPAGMMSAFQAAAKDRDPTTVHVEWFEAPPDPQASSSASAESQTSNAFLVRLAKSGTTVQVEPDRSILEALETAGVDIPSSCGDGICGSCEATVLSGRVVHRDHVLTAAEREKGDRMMVCVSRCLDQELVLDL